MSFHQPPVTFVDTVHLNVANLDRSRIYYKDVIGLTVSEQTDTTVTLSADPDKPLVVLHQDGTVAPKPDRTTGLYHFAILLPSRNDLAQVVRHLIRKREPVASSDHLVSEALYLNDPDGNGIEIYRDRDPDNWTWQNGMVHMTVDPLDFEDLLSKEPEAPWNGLPEGTVMGHMHLHVSDVKEAEAFYTDVLGFQTVSRFSDHAVFLSDAHYHHHIALNIWNGRGIPAPPLNTAGLKHYTIVYPDIKALDEVKKRLNDNNIKADTAQNRFTVTDPAGKRLVLTSF
ncbi:VOC family protein [Salisediminibacterium selenitireducens]|uniref:Glyoxalase/bleomycin resistance protein/dioxygenase n=1 Tax=Bacillus selenitireducens (strain ATCC 700615 / DSM 15326 / MLS10) TaxID=439292 RepID=D6XZR7_BACIE|nr:VOC family protein [Salisediminibacterium selenitireducens]ADI00419.1 Glyoxalase/bleomycin resistance protein/dioxygenase [[Bacillus] selenitireducens MLS10]